MASLGHICSIVPPYLLASIRDSSSCSDNSKESATHTFNHTLSFIGRRVSQIASARQGPAGGIVPQYLTSHIAQSDAVTEQSRESARTTLAGGTSTDQKPIGETYKVNRRICDAKHEEDPNLLPGTTVRTEGQSEEGLEKAVDDCYDNLGRVFDFYAKVLHRNSVNGKGMELIGNVHFGTKYGNAFWDGRQMVFGDGDDELLTNFTGSLDVIGHELTHGVTQYTANLEYQGQSGALNESVSDVFGSLVRQYRFKESAAEADWLTGEDCILPTVKGVALRSMKAPGTAYNDPKLGKDPQPAHMKDYVNLPLTVEGDNGGVHYNSGIPNHAFYLAAIAFGGNAWDKAGPIWYNTLVSPDIKPQSTFKEFAEITVNVAKKLFSDAEATIVKKAWADVGVYDSYGNSGT